jgi:SAM-dependent methyltransferase
MLSLRDAAPARQIKAFLSKLPSVSEQAFLRYGEYYDLLYSDKDYVAEADYVARILQSASPSVRTLLEFGSGTGRHGRLLAGHGFDVFGIERSESMVAEGRRPGPDVTHGSGRFNCRGGDIRTVELDRVFDAVISLFHVVSYQTTNRDLVATFANAARHLSTGGIFFFDVWHGPAVLQGGPSVRVKRMEDANTRLTRIAEPELDVNAGIVTVKYTVLAESKVEGRLTTFDEVHRMRYLFPSEIAFLATQTGFRVEFSEQFLTGTAPSTESWGVAYLLRKCDQHET